MTSLQDQNQNTFFVKLRPRGVIYVEGDDRKDFLQRIVTNDLNLLEEQSAIYSCLLTPQGKFLHDFFISKGPDSYFIECEGQDRASDLYQHLNRYKLRSAVTMSLDEQTPVYACFGVTPTPGYQDPRHAGLGWRSFSKPEDTIRQEPFELWDRLRINLEIADGSRDAVLERSTLEELNIPRHNGVSFTKGCYVGQELTARVENRGLAKKHLRLFSNENEQSLPAFGEIIKDGDKTVGEMRSSCHDIGLAVIRDAQAT